MRIALISPLPPEQTGIADYAAAFKNALEGQGVTVDVPFSGMAIAGTPESVARYMAAIDWAVYDVVHAELGGGRIREFLALEWLAAHAPTVALTATVHDPERLIWKPASLPGPLAMAARLPRAVYQALVLLADPLTLARERRLARRLSGIVTLTETGARCLEQRMKLASGAVTTIAHGNFTIDEQAPPIAPPDGPLKLLYFGFIYKGKGIEDLIDAIALLFRQRPEAQQKLSLTLAGGTAPDIAFGDDNSYIAGLQRQLTEAGLAESHVHWQLDVPAAEIPHIIQAHHVLVLPYKESKKLAFLGRMLGTSGALSWANACGRGVISSDARAFVEEVSHGNGAVFPQGDSVALATELVKLLDQPETIGAWSRSATAMGQARAWPRIASAFSAMFKSVSGKSHD
ncbi:glycosyltransferase [Methylomonas sp. MED-D]|uniref:glycosyltransferase n=1 Tax=unclassified Methylomonas TaxID=2608980 RepID=UPI0028A31E49|nr:glycosyltransferase [Methylomonas sp. MV1]MDT4330992.1 glycosyltransferase [Methylomonas sp. MV1]